jgi:hypothetical protein
VSLTTAQPRPVLDGVVVLVVPCRLLLLGLGFLVVQLVIAVLSLRVVNLLALLLVMASLA